MSEEPSTPAHAPVPADYGLPAALACPFCDSAAETELHSPFGPQLSVATYWCRRCRAPFDFLKWTGRQP